MTDLKFEQKLSTLKRVLEIYVIFMKRYTKVDVSVNYHTNIIKVRYSGKIGEYYDAESTEFPVSHLNKRIIHYKNKIKSEFKKRHSTMYYINKYTKTDSEKSIINDNVTSYVGY